MVNILQSSTPSVILRPKSAPALRVGGRRVITADKHRSVAAATDLSDWMFDREEFNRLSAQYGPFTVDAAADTNGNNAHVTAHYYSSASSFLDADIAGEKVWCNPPFAHAADFISHYLSCKSEAPTTTSGLFILPKWNRWSHLTHNMTLVHEYPARMQLFTKPVTPGSAERTAVGPTPWPVQVYYDPPSSLATSLATICSGNPATSTYRYQPTPVAPSALPPPPPAPPPKTISDTTHCVTNLSTVAAADPHSLLVLSGKYKGHFLRVLVDSGASSDFISTSAVTRLRLAPQELAEAIRVRLADGSLSTTDHSASFPFTLSTFTEERDYIVTSLQGYDIILGKPWLSQHNPVINWTTNTVTSPFLLRGIKTPAAPALQHVTAEKMVRLSRKADTQLFIGNISAISSPSATTPPPNLLQPDTCLSPPSQQLYHNLLDKFKSSFDEPTGVHVRSGVYHHIPLKDGANVPQHRTRRMSPAELEEVQKQLKWYLERGWIRPSDSAYGAPVVFAKKPDGTLRFCVDYRALNAITKKSNANLPRIDETLDQLKGAQYFTSVDLFSGYHQVPLAPDDIHKTAFSTRYGNYEFTVMPFGLTSAPHTFQALMNNILRPFIDKFVLVYLDDVMIYSRTEQEHLQHVEQVLQALADAQLHIKASKCKFAKESTVFLGYLVNRSGIHLDPKKVAAIHDWTLPSNITEVRAFLGFTGFYRRFIRNYSTIAAPLTSLTSATKPFPPKLPADAVDAFRQLQTAISTAPVLTLPETGPDSTFTLYTDASLVGIGGVLEQDDRPVCFESRKLSPAERNYPVHELELLAVVHCLRTFRHYLEGCKQFILYTDHQSLKYIFTQKDLSRRQTRWLDDLADFQPNMEIAYKPGKLNRADALSRHIQSLNLLTSYTVSSDTLISDIKSAYSSDPFYSDTSRPSYLTAHADLWLFRDRICVPNDSTLRMRILQDYHDAPSAGHPGYHRTLTSIASHFWWPRMTRTVRAFVASCPTCQRAKPSTLPPPGLLRPHAIPSRPWSHMSMDLVTDLPRSLGPDGVYYDAIATFVCMLTKQAFFVRTHKTVDAKGLAHLYIDNVYRLKGLSQVIVSDRDTRITSEFWQTLFARLGTSLNLSTAHHPQTDGQTERTHRTIEQILRAYVDPHHDDWATWLPVAEFTYNNSTHSATSVTPFMANYGYDPSTPASLALPSLSPSTASTDYAVQLRDLHDFIMQQSADAKARYADYSNRSRRDLTFRVGDSVRLSTNNINLQNQPSTKLRSRFLGPFTVTDIISPVSYRLSLPPSFSRMHHVFHVSRLLPWTPNDPTVFPGRHVPAQPIPSAKDYIYGDDVFIVDSLLDCKIEQGQLRFLVGWAAPFSDPKHNSWEPMKNLSKLDAYRAYIASPAFATFASTAAYQQFAAKYPKRVP
jgi:transposase InsO family protein